MIDIPNQDRNQNSFNARFKECDFAWNTGSDRLSGKFFYLPFRDEELTKSEFIDYLVAEAINYAVSYTRREEKHSLSTPSSLSSLIALKKEVKNLFVNTKTAGEFGELIIYLILRDCFDAPQLVTKMSLKTSGGVAYHGADGLHVSISGENLLLYFAESKVHDDENPNAAIKAAIKSAKTITNNEVIKNKTDGARDFEINLIDRHFSLPKCSEETKKQILKFLNPLEPEINNLKFISPCFVGFNHSFYKKMNGQTNLEELFLTEYRTTIENAAETFRQEIVDQELSHKNFIFLLMPFDSIVDLRKAFLEKLS